MNNSKVRKTPMISNWRQLRSRKTVKSQKSKLTQLASGALTILVVANVDLAVPEKVQAQSASEALLSLNLHTARSEATKLSVYPGRTSIIDFSSSDEIIISIKLGDSSRTVYSTDLPLDTAKAKTIFVEAMQPLSFPGATRASVTNLAVKTLNQATGEQQLYLFDIHHKGKGKSAINGVRLVPGGAMPRSGVATWRVGSGSATLGDIERGLEVALSRGWSLSHDPVVRQVWEFLALAYNTELPLEEAAAKSGLSLAVISELAEIGIEHRFILPITQPTTDPNLRLEPIEQSAPLEQLPAALRRGGDRGTRRQGEEFPSEQ